LLKWLSSVSRFYQNTGDKCVSIFGRNPKPIVTPSKEWGEIDKLVLPFVYNLGVENHTTLAVSIRLDQEAQRALRILEASGLTRSDAIRTGLRIAARDLQRKEVIRREVALLEADEDDRREMLEIAAFLAGLRAEG
jgi:antitoxin component of RelBE/YafQ-DinJ toxin-antitoxin module